MLNVGGAVDLLQPRRDAGQGLFKSVLCHQYLQQVGTGVPPAALDVPVRAARQWPVRQRQRLGSVRQRFLRIEPIGEALVGQQALDPDHLAYQLRVVGPSLEQAPEHLLATQQQLVGARRLPERSHTQTAEQIRQAGVLHAQIQQHVVGRVAIAGKLVQIGHPGLRQRLPCRQGALHVLQLVVDVEEHGAGQCAGLVEARRGALLFRARDAVLVQGDPVGDAEGQHRRDADRRLPAVTAHEAGGAVGEAVAAGLYGPTVELPPDVVGEGGDRGVSPRGFAGDGAQHDRVEVPAQLRGPGLIAAAAQVDARCVRIPLGDSLFEARGRQAREVDGAFAGEQFV